ncbi:MAG TPA: DNA cytosine methyltransferase [Pseudoalteromonas prydzensis]|uniref:Cytosine-specific methyltransferase n=2 Tax=root TaxID=1 RepID=A0A7V1CYD4_9GAMM|nr:DNA (cytosine-5-)-methyltransferase [Pseudoalteromonas prydzensis]HEA16573.1 DNA cytosine methyltransferase [Pseudoalteromonas prydzensis]
MNHIELFAGCGGLTLGLESVGFKTVLANELSPMAAETFAYNFFNEDLAQLAEGGLMPQNTLWLNSNYKDLKPRLRENPLSFPEFKNKDGFSDLPDDLKNIQNKLIVGSIVELNKLLEANSELCNELHSSFGKGELDLVSGGPPCQSFSMAGMRKKNCDKNTLPWEFATFVSLVRPKIAMLENVTGILRAFKDEEGNQFHAWYEVAKVFATKGYIPLCLHINARFAGIAQNRPRFIMIAIREDYFEKLKHLNDAETKLFKQSLSFFKKAKKNINSVKFGDLPYFDITNVEHFKLFKDSFLSSLIADNTATVKDALDDLKLINPSETSAYINELNTHFSGVLGNVAELKNHELRVNSDIVKRRFRVYQILQDIDKKQVTKDVFNILKNGEATLSNESAALLLNKEFLNQQNKLVKFKNKFDLVQYLLGHPTKKQTQKALIANAPAPAALSIPDDACHYDKNELRVLTVREMARIQSFPDQFEFRSKVTTGGQMRKFEVPQYTQVGNAVPPLLGQKLGACLVKLTERL